jgi:hypothetical protein
MTSYLILGLALVEMIQYALGFVGYVRERDGCWTGGTCLRPGACGTWTMEQGGAEDPLPPCWPIPSIDVQ